LSIDVCEYADDQHEEVAAKFVHDIMEVAHFSAQNRPKLLIYYICYR
jgi:hypothetical protein